MLSLSIVAACIIGCNYAVNCPSGTSKVMTMHRSGSEECIPGTSRVDDIDFCKTRCESWGHCNCRAFGYSDQYHDCVLYQSATPGYSPPGTPDDQFLCAFNCPTGTIQVGGIGAYFQNAQQVYTLFADNIEQCSYDCHGRPDCTAFSYDEYICIEYNANSDLEVNDGGPYANRILCTVTADFSAQSPGLFSVDGMVGYRNGNGQVYAQIPAYVVYGIVALILVNIVCLMVHCWNKSKGNSKYYKTVPMRSDIDEETDIA